jgi:hypothetical protein
LSVKGSHRRPRGVPVQDDRDRRRSAIVDGTHSSESGCLIAGLLFDTRATDPASAGVSVVAATMGLAAVAGS